MLGDWNKRDPGWPHLFSSLSLVMEIILGDTMCDCDHSLVSLCGAFGKHGNIFYYTQLFLHVCAAECNILYI